MNASVDVVCGTLGDKDLQSAIQTVRAGMELANREAWRGSAIDEVLAATRAFVESPPAAMFDQYRSTLEDRAINVRELDPSASLWFVGDLHGDLLSLECALRYIAQVSGNEARITFLGDLFDGSAHGAAVVLRVWRRLAEQPAATAVLAGNHDESLFLEGNRFGSRVTPADLSEWLEVNKGCGIVRRFGRLVVEFFARAPRALFLPDGLLVSHGGIPAPDQYPIIRDTADWNTKLCLQDFAWTRWCPRKKRVRPHRNSLDIGIGTETFKEFCKLATDLGRPVAGLVRGHSHVEDCFEYTPVEGTNGVLTVNTMCTRDLLRSGFASYERQPVVARWRPGQAPEVHRISIPADVVRSIYPDPEGNPADEPVDQRVLV